VRPPRWEAHPRDVCDDYRLLASQLPEIIRTDCTRSAGAFALEPMELLLMPEPDVPDVLPVPEVLPVPDVLPVPLVLPEPVVPAVLPVPDPVVLPVPAVLPLPVLPVPAVPDVEPVPDVPEVEPAPAP